MREPCYCHLGLRFRDIGFGVKGSGLRSSGLRVWRMENDVESGLTWGICGIGVQKYGGCGDYGPFQGPGYQTCGVIWMDL